MLRFRVKNFTENNNWLTFHTANENDGYSTPWKNNHNDTGNLVKSNKNNNMNNKKLLNVDSII